MDILNYTDVKEQTGKVAWSSPSNIALVKYWGKYGRQLPANSSLSFTLSKATTKMELEWVYDLSISGPNLEFLFEDKPSAVFANKIQIFLESIVDIFPYLTHLDLKITSANTFPHSAGIASSASSMSSLALCLCTIEEDLSNSSHSDFFKKASFVARLGSGSAGRSLYKGLVSWGEHPDISGPTSDEFSSPFSDYHPVFDSYKDSIAIVDSSKKQVSSRVGHALMNDHPFREVRFTNAQRNLSKLCDALRSGDLESFIQVVESEALELHGLMFNSNPSFILLKPNTLNIIEKIRAFRITSQVPLCFTLDAGPNVHILYPESYAAQVEIFLEEQVKPFTENGLILSDHVGTGPERIK